MATFFEFDPNRPLAFIDELANKWAPAVIPLYYEDQSGEFDLRCKGSAVFVRYGSRVFLASAYHVVAPMRLTPHIESVISGKRVDLTHLPFYVDRAEDVAVAYIPDVWYADRGIEGMLPLNVPDVRPAHLRSDRYILLGYPSHLNQVRCVEDKPRDLRSLSVDEISNLVRSADSAATLIGFHYDPNSVSDNALQPIEGLRRLNGMSGGPALQLLAGEGALTPVEFTVRLAGIVSEWNAESHQILATSVHALETVLHRYTAKLNALDVA